MPKKTNVGLTQENDSLKQQIAALANEVKSMKDKFQATNSSGETLKREAERSPQFLSDEYDDLNTFSASMVVELKDITRRLNDLNAQVEGISDAIAQAEEYSSQFIIKIIGLPEMKDNESAEDTSALCLKLFQEMGAEVAFSDIDIAHRVPTKYERTGAKPLIRYICWAPSKGQSYGNTTATFPQKPNTYWHVCWL